MSTSLGHFSPRMRVWLAFLTDWQYQQIVFRLHFVSQWCAGQRQSKEASGKGKRQVIGPQVGRDQWGACARAQLYVHTCVQLIGWVTQRGSRQCQFRALELRRFRKICHIFRAFVALKPLVSLISLLVACSSRLNVDGGVIYSR